MHSTIFNTEACVFDFINNQFNEESWLSCLRGFTLHSMKRVLVKFIVMYFYFYISQYL